MKSRPEHLLDRCLHQLNEGGDVEEVLAAYPELADELRPALAASEWMRAFAPPPRRRLEQKGRFVAAVAERRRLVERVDGLVVEIKAGVAPDELGARLDTSLRPIVAAAHRMHAAEVPMPAPERVAEGRARLVALVAERRRAVRPSRMAAVRSVPRGVLQGLLPTPSFARRLLTSTAALSLAATLALAGVLRVESVAASSLPGEAFYGVKRLGENARMLFAFDPTHRATLEAMFARRRMNELVQLDAAGRPVPADLVEEWLVGGAAADGALHDLTRDQRAALARAVKAMADDAAARARLERRGVGPEMLDALVAPEPGVAPDPARDEPVGLHRGPSLRPQPLPDEPERRPEASDPPPMAQPNPVPPAASASPQPPVGFVEAVGAPSGSGSGGRDESQSSGGQAADPSPGEPGAMPVEPGAGEEPPAEPPPFMEPIDPGPQAPPEDPSSAPEAP